MKVDVVAVVGVLQLVGHHPQSHDLLPDERVRPRDVHPHLWVIQLVGQAVLLDFREVPEQSDETREQRSNVCSDSSFRETTGDPAAL